MAFCDATHFPRSEKEEFSETDESKNPRKDFYNFCKRKNHVLNIRIFSLFNAFQRQILLSSTAEYANNDATSSKEKESVYVCVHEQKVRKRENFSPLC